MAAWLIPASATAAGIFVLGAFAGATRAADLAYGAYLAQECVTCHRAHVNEAAGIPAIVGRPAPDLIDALHEYRAGRRADPVMQNVARSLDDEQIEALAAYFASVENGKEEP